MLPLTDGASIIDLVRSRSASTNVPQGRWVPPPVRHGQRTITVFHVYRSVGDFSASFAYGSSSTGAPLGRDPYSNSTTATIAVPVR